MEGLLNLLIIAIQVDKVRGIIMQRIMAGFTVGMYLIILLT